MGRSSLENIKKSSSKIGSSKSYSKIEKKLDIIKELEQS